MELNINQNMKQILSVFILIILPMLLIGLGAVFGVLHALFYILLILWFCMGVIFFNATN